MMLKFVKVALLGGGLLMSMLAVQANAQNKYPDKPIRVIVPFPAGGVTDIVARLVMHKVSEDTQMTFMIDNRAGAGGTIGTAAAARSAADGYTVLLGAASTIAVAPAIYPNPGYDPGMDFVAVGGLAAVPIVLITGRRDKYKRLPDVINAAKAQPGALTYGSSGYGAAQHIQMELLKLRLALNIMHVPYTGGPQALTDLMGGRIDFMMETLATALPHLTSKVLTGVAISQRNRWAGLPDVPTFEEAGVPDFLVATWFGLFAPKNTAPAIVNQLDAALRKALQDPALVKSMRERGIDPMPMNAQKLTKYAADERARWKSVVVQSGIKIE